MFGVVLAVFTHHRHEPSGASAVLDGLVRGLAATAVFFLALALTLPTLGLISFVIATAAALITQACTMFAIPIGAGLEPPPDMARPKGPLGSRGHADKHPRPHWCGPGRALPGLIHGGCAVRNGSSRALCRYVILGEPRRLVQRVDLLS